MYEEETYPDKDFEPSDSRFSLLDGLIRLLEVRLEEAERRISVLENCIKRDQRTPGSASVQLLASTCVACLDQRSVDRAL